MAETDHIMWNPLIIKTIFEHLEAKDIINIGITNATFTTNDDYRHTVDILLTQRKMQMCTQHIVNLLNAFQSRTTHSLNVWESELNDEFCLMFDYVCDNKWVFEKYPEIADVCESILIDHMNVYYSSMKAEYYLYKLFNIEVEEDILYSNDNESYMNTYYIITTKNEKIFV